MILGKILDKKAPLQNIIRYATGSHLSLFINKILSKAIILGTKIRNS